MKHGKRFKEYLNKIDRLKEYELTDAVTLIKDNSKTNFEKVLDKKKNKKI